MAKKILLKSRQEAVFYTMAGISCHMMDYRLLHNLNKKTGFTFARDEDLKVQMPGKEEARFSFFIYRDEDQRNNYYLVANSSHEIILLPEFRTTDFILLIEGDLKKQRFEQLLKEIRTIPNVLTAYEINIRDIKNPEAFLEDLEMHVTNIRKERKQKTKLTQNY
jgi:hypothetical protein